MPITALTDAFYPINKQLFPIKDHQRRWLAPVHGAVSSLWLASLVNTELWQVADRLKIMVARDQNQLNLILSVSKDGTARLKGLEVEGQRQVMGWW